MKTWMIAAAVLFPLAAARADVDKKTERTWKAKCASCHGADGKGQTDQGQKMGISDYTSAAWQKGITDDQIKAAINNGVKREKNGKAQEMDPFSDKLDAGQIDGLVAYVRSLKG
jgi:mono/diheme cytochrome c family protein